MLANVKRREPRLAPADPQFILRLEQARLVERAERHFDFLTIAAEHAGAARGAKVAVVTGRALPRRGLAANLDLVARKIAKALNALACALRQVRQWHSPTRNGSPRVVNCTAPHAHPPWWIGSSFAIRRA